MSTGIGDRLRDEREFLGRSIEQAARETRVREEYLRALEHENFSVFGGDVYAKGFLSSYARYLELDPAPLLEQYRREVQQGGEEATERLASGAVTDVGSTGSPTWLVWALAALVTVGGIVGLGQLVGGRTPGPATPEGEAPPQPVASPTDTVPPSPAGTPTSSPTPTAAPTGVNLVVDVEERCWMRVTVDDEVIFSQTVEAGGSESWEAAGPITVRYGNPGGVNVRLNGEDLGVAGPAGSPITVTYTPEGIEGADDTSGAGTPTETATEQG